jgi:hypothetical protein
MKDFTLYYLFKMQPNALVIQQNFIVCKKQVLHRASERNGRRWWCTIMAMKVAVLKGERSGWWWGVMRGGGCSGLYGSGSGTGRWHVRMQRGGSGVRPGEEGTRAGSACQPSTERACLRVSLPKRPPSSPLWCTTAAARLPRSPSDHIKGRPAIHSSNCSSITTFTVIVLPSSSSATRPATLTAGGGGGRALISSSSRQWPRGPSPRIFLSKINSRKSNFLIFLRKILEKPLGI